MIPGIVLMLAALVVVTAAAWWLGYLRILSPLTWYLVFHGVALTGRAINIYLVDDYWRFIQAVGEFNESAVTWASACISIGLVAFFIGYTLAMERRSGACFRLRDIPWSRKSALLVALFFTAMGIRSALLYRIMPMQMAMAGLAASGPTMVFTETTAYIALASHFIGAVVLLLCCRFGLRWWVLSFAVSAWAMGLFGGWNRWVVVLSVLGVAFVEQMRSPRRRYLWTLVLVAPVFGLLLARIGKNRMLLPSVIAGRASIVELLQPGEGPNVNWDTDLSQFNGIVWATTVTPEYRKFRGFSHYIDDWAIAAVPRVLWPGKPIPEEWNADLGLYEYGLGTSRGLVGGFYEDMGLVGVILGMTGAGWLLGFCFNLYRRNRDRVYVMFFYCVVLSMAPISFRSGLRGMPMYLSFWMMPGLVMCLIALALGGLRAAEGRRRVEKPGELRVPV